MISIPAFKAHLRAVPVAGEGVLLLSERRTFVLRGGAYEQVAPLIDGRRSADDIVVAVAGTVDPALAWHALMRLEAAGYIEEHAPGVDRGVAAFWQALGVEPAAATAALRAAAPRIFADSRQLAMRLGRGLEQFGTAAPTVRAIGPVDVRDEGSDFDVVLTDDYLADALLEIAGAARAAGRRWLLARPFGSEIWVGPLFRPGAAGCLRCLRRRLGQRRSARLLAARHDPAGGAGAPLGATPATAEAGCLLAATEAAKALAGVEPALDGVLSFDLHDRSSRVHRLIADPACPVCGGPAQPAAAVRLQRRPVEFDAEGGHRTAPPEATLRRCEHLVSPIIGVIGSLTPAAGVDEVGRSYLVDDQVGGRPDTLRSLVNLFRVGSTGKGISDAQARASALGEALERYSGQVLGGEVRIPGAFNDMGEDAIHPNRVANFSARQYAGRAAWNARHPSRHYVPERFDPDVRIDWTPVWSLTRRRHRLLPTEMLYMGQGWDGAVRQGARFGYGDSNGCAAGNTIEEAVLQGFFELVERDAAAMWWYNRTRRPAVDPGSFGDPWIAELPRRYGVLGRDVVALDLTTDLGIPVFAGLSHRREGGSEGILIGFGCHLDPRIALQRALVEMCQMLTVDMSGNAAIAGLGDGWLHWATRANQPYLVPDETVAVRSGADFAGPRHADLLESIEWCRERVEACGMEMLVLDQTRSDVGLPVARVIVPGLRHFWARFGPGRLYDVPVALGWLPSPVAEEDLNPVPFFW